MKLHIFSLLMLLSLVSVNKNIISNVPAEQTQPAPMNIDPAAVQPSDEIKDDEDDSDKESEVQVPEAK